MKRLGFVCFLAMLAAPALADIAPSTQAPSRGAACQSMEAAKAEISTIIAAKGGYALKLMGKDAAAYLAVVNAVPPQTHLAGDGVLLLVVKQGVAIGIITGDSVCMAGHIGSDVHVKALEATEANPSGDKPKLKVEAPAKPDKEHFTHDDYDRVDA